MDLIANKNFLMEDWGEVPYEEALHRQLLAVEECAETKQEKLIFCYHPAVVTVGRGTRQGDVFSWSGERVEVSRGGRATYHGPNQQVIYPILSLGEGKIFPYRDLHKYLRFLEQKVCECLWKWNLPAYTRQDSLVDEEGRALEMTGVWIEDRKIASIGIAVKMWVSYHGISINLYEDKNAFQGIRPCGFSPDIMTSIEKESGQKIPRDEVCKTFMEMF